jgi:LytTr DNA-binding domain
MGERVGPMDGRLAARRALGKVRRMQFEGASGEIGGSRWWARALSFAGVVGVLMGVLGPFGSYLNPMPLRVLDQVVMIVSGTVLAGTLIPLQLRLGRRLGLPLLFTLAVAIVVTAVPIAALSALVSKLIWPWNVAHYHISNWYFEALLMLTALFALWVILETALRAWRSAAAPPPGAPSEIVAGPALCLQTEDNYVRIHHAHGSRLELMPLHEAIARYGQADGLQVHRGWWVAAAAVEGAERDARNWRLRLVNGLRAPVARNRVVEARARGWLREKG